MRTGQEEQAGHGVGERNGVVLEREAWEGNAGRSKWEEIRACRSIFAYFCYQGTTWHATLVLGACMTRLEFEIDLFEQFEIQICILRV
jgi:hypothetical protein